MDAMADQIRTQLAGNGVDIQVEPRYVINPTPPCIDIYPADPMRDDASAGFDDIAGMHVFNVRARVAVADNVSEQDLLLEFLDDESDLCIAGALFDDPTLGGHATAIGFESISGFTLFPTVDGSGVHIGALLRVQVIPARS